MSATEAPIDALRNATDVDQRRLASAMLNILEDAAGETSRLASTQSAVLNILEDIAEERGRFDATYRAVLNILDDSAEEKVLLSSMQSAVLNVLEDAGVEKLQLEATQQAVLNILEDSAAEKAELADTQRAALNVLEDFESEKNKVEQVNTDLRNEIRERLRVEQALRQATAAAEAASKELEAFSYSVAHDLRAPLRSLDGFSQALVEDFGSSLDPEAIRYLHHIRDASEHMGELIDDLLKLSRITRAELRREDVDVSALAELVVGRLREADPDRDVAVRVEPGLRTAADPKLLEIVLTNLIGNAWKFTRKSEGPRIDVGYDAASRPAAFFVRDNGAGFDPRYAEKLFGVFQRLHSTQEFEGTGIGLATVRRIVLRHGGDVWAEGAVGKGATFHFTLEEALS